jgi:hypothetical protein
MVRTELLRAKSLHAEVHYLKDLQKVGDMKRHHDQHSKALKEKENQFWKEAVKGHGKVPNNQTPTPLTAQQTATQLDRMWRAHSQLKEAHQKRESSAKKLQEGLATLSTSKQRIDSLQKLVSKAEKLRANRLESRISEEVAELVGTTRAIAELRGKFEESQIRTPATSQSVAYNAHSTDQTLKAAVPNQTASERLTDRVPGETRLEPVPAPPASTQIAPQAQPLQPQLMQAPAALRAEPLSIRAIEAPTPISAPLQIGNVEFHRHESHSALTISASIGSAPPVNLVITKGEGSGLKVVVDPGVSGLAGQLSRDKSVLQSRLQALGIKVTSLEVGPADDSPQQARRNSRKALTDPDEELIA